MAEVTGFPVTVRTDDGYDLTIRVAAGAVTIHSPDLATWIVLGAERRLEFTAAFAAACQEADRQLAQEAAVAAGTSGVPSSLSAGTL